MNRAESAKIVAVIVTACPSQSSKLDRERIAGMIDTFASLLDDIPYEQVNAAIRVLLQTRTWMPSVADIRDAALELVRGPVQTGAEAWGSVMRAMKEQGVYRTPGHDFVFRDSTAARVVAALGWTELCSSENTIADRARFIDAYDSMAKQDRKEHLSPVLIAAKEQRAEISDTVKFLAKKLTVGE